MKAVTQQGPDDCLPACIASIFELELDVVPQFVRGDSEDDGAWFWEMQRWASRTLEARPLPVQWEPDSASVLFDGCYSIALCSVKGMDHAVVMYGAEIVWNPGLFNVTEEDIVGLIVFLDTMSQFAPPDVTVSEQAARGRNLVLGSDGETETQDAG